MGNDIYYKLPNETFLNIFAFLNDKTLINCSNLDLRLSKLTRINCVWQERIKIRFQKSINLFGTHDDEAFKQYVKSYNQEFFIKHLIEPITKEMIECVLIRGSNSKHYKFIDSYFVKTQEIILIKSIIDAPIGLVININPLCKENNKYYKISSNKKYLSMYNKFWYKIEGSQRETLDIDEVWNDIGNLLNQGYYIAKQTISKKIGDELLIKSFGIKC
jgi:hypothetical protein